MFPQRNLTPKQSIELQKQLREQIELTPLAKEIKTVGGCDASMSMFAKEGFAGFVTLSYPDLVTVDHSVIKDTIPFPYIPGLLSFREIPMLLKAWKGLKKKPDILLVDGVGIATHLGLELGISTIGCAKSVLVGTYEESDNEPGSHTYMYDKREVIGAALRTKRNVKPVFVSPGHKITLDEAIDIVRSCVIHHRLPEPTRRAHNAVNEYRIGDA